MALTACSECRRKVSDRAQTCPHCGCPIAGHQVSLKRPQLPVPIAVSIAVPIGSARSEGSTSPKAVTASTGARFPGCSGTTANPFADLEHRSPLGKLLRTSGRRRHRKVSAMLFGFPVPLVVYLFCFHVFPPVDSNTGTRWMACWMAATIWIVFSALIQDNEQPSAYEIRVQQHKNPFGSNGC
jgi:hypothetical protein